MTRRLRSVRTERRTSDEARLRAHLLALAAWEAAWDWCGRWRPTAVIAPGEAVRCRTRLMRRAAAATDEARGRAAERAFIAADLRVWAEQGGDPWMVHVADEVAAGRRPETDNNDGVEGREGVT
jgi:hypothetical protein